ncbi:MAG: GNAT family N-acetyltransferase [Sphingomicrobium sp.]
MPDRFELADARDLPLADVERFALDVWHSADEVAEKWWLQSRLADVLTLVDKESRAIAAICVAVPSHWIIPGSGVVPVRSICSWNVSPHYQGLKLGQRLVETIESHTPFMNTLSISTAAVKSFAKMGWAGPRSTSLRLCPLPRWRGRGGQSPLTVETVDVVGASLPAALAATLDRIEAAAPDVVHRRRTAADWIDHLAVYPGRRTRFHLIGAGAGPIGYAVTRATDEQAGLRLRAARLHYVTDVALDQLDEAQLEAALRLVAGSVDWSAGALLLCTGSVRLAAAAARAGWLTEHSPILGPRLAAKAPQYMLGGAFADYAGADLPFTFCDSDVDLNL